MCCSKDHSGGIGIIGAWQARRAMEKHDQKIREDTIKAMNGRQPKSAFDRRPRRQARL